MASEKFPDVTRVELILEGQRSVAIWNVTDVEIHLQDLGRTIKVFMREGD